MRQDLVLARAEHDEASGLLLTRSHMVWAFPRVVEPCAHHGCLVRAPPMYYVLQCTALRRFMPHVPI